MEKYAEPPRISTGVAGLDDILVGGLPQGHTYLVEGKSGTGKTTLGLQFLLEGKRLGESCLFVTLSESKAEIEESARSHGWSLDGITIAEFVPDEASLSDEAGYTVFHPGEVELATTIKRLLAEIERVDPDRLVIDSLSEFRLLAPDPTRYRRQLLALKQYFSNRHATVLLIDDHSKTDADQHMMSIVHGVVRFSRMERSYGAARRQMEVVKMRASAFREGNHDYTLKSQGVVAFPRLVAAEHGDNFVDEHLLSTLPRLDAMFGGGIERGSSTLVMGPAGVGKSSIVTQYAYAASQRGERAVIYSFDETLRTAIMRARSLGMQVEREIERKLLFMEQIDTAELSPGEFAWKIRDEVEENNARVVVIDSLNGFLHSMSAEEDLTLHLHELLAYLNQKGVDTFLVLAQESLMGEGPRPVDVSYLSDTLLILRYFEAEASVRRAISVLKKRSGRHENTIRELHFSSNGIQIGEPLSRFKGLLSGIPDLIKTSDIQPEE